MRKATKIPGAVLNGRSTRLSKSTICLLHIFTSSTVSRRRKSPVVDHVFVVKDFFGLKEAGNMSAVERRRIVGVGRFVSSGTKAMGFSGGHPFGGFSSFSRLIAGFFTWRIREKNCE